MPAPLEDPQLHSRSNPCTFRSAGLALEVLGEVVVAQDFQDEQRRKTIV